MTPAAASPQTAPAPEQWQIVNAAQSLALDLSNLLRVADDYVSDAFPNPMSPEVMAAFEATCALISACRMMADKLKGVVDDVR